jgi:Short C-terminal domain
MLRRPIARGGRPGVIGTMARTAVIAGTATAVSGGVARRQQAKAQEAADAEAYQEMQREQQYAAAAPPPPTPSAPPDDMVAQLKELASLKEQGILTDEEFAAQKARILGA